MITKKYLLIIFFLFSTMIYAQSNYKNSWKNIDKLEQENLPKSALKIVNKLYLKAQQENNSAQIIKCLFYKSKLTLILEEDAQLKIIEEFKNQINKSNFPNKNILQNILAKLYWDYFTENKWKFYQRTKTSTKPNPSDFRTWDLTTLFNEIHKNYSQSLANKEKLKQLKIKQYSDIIKSNKNSKNTVTSLFEFLTENALQFYKTPENSITKPKHHFKLDNPNLLSDYNSFARLNLAPQTTFSLNFNAVKLYQELIQNHIKSKNYKALIKTDIDRLQYINKYSTINNKTTLLLKTLEESFKNTTTPSKALYKLEIAKVYFNKGELYYNNKKHQFGYKKALEICKEIINKYPDSEAKAKSTVLKESILNKTIEIINERYIPSNTFSRLLVRYKNINNITISAYKISDDKVQELNKTYKKSEKLNIINTLNQIAQWNYNLKDEKDHQTHSTEIIIPKLKNGNYLLVAHTEKKISDQSCFGYAALTVTNLVVITNEINNENIYQIVDRNSGKPVKNAQVNINNLPSNNYKHINKNYRTNNNGIFKITTSKNDYYGQVKAVVTAQNETAIFNDIHINQHHNTAPQTKEHSTTFLFTDRSIYRPNQTIYFKGICIKRVQNKSEILTQKKVTLKLVDTNHQTIKKQTFKTNEFGSFSGEFKTPENGLTGEYTLITSINDNENYHQISVEEYKRPKFEIGFSPLNKNFRINDIISLNGFAKTFSGVNLSNAKVSYHIQRKISFPDWHYWSRPQHPNSETQEIKQGKITTDNKGFFNITFKALANLNVNKLENPIYKYIINVDVTDINGETHHKSTTINIGHHTLTAHITIDDIINTNQKSKNLKIETQNLNGNFIPATGNLNIYKLTAPKQVFRNRPWEAPDYQTIPKKEFREKFPYDAYINEDDYRNWNNGELVFKSAVNTAKTKNITLTKTKNWKAGKYRIELIVNDKTGEKTTIEKYFSVVNNKEKLPVDNKLFTITPNKDTYKVGDEAKIKIATNSNDLTVMLYIEKQSRVIKEKYIHLNKNSKTITIPVTSDDLGGFGIKYHFVNKNYFNNGSLVVNVPFPEKKLEVETKTFRNKIEPGKKETWSFIISKNKIGITSEVLAGMYDASLDQFLPHKWNFTPNNHQNYYTHNDANGYYSFKNNAFNFYNVNKPNLSYTPYKTNIDYNWYGFYFANGSYQTFGAATPYMMKRNLATEKDKVMANADYTSRSKDEKKQNNNTYNQELKEETATKTIQIRKNLQETAFFYPHIQTDKNGYTEITFTTPENLSKWKVNLLAYDKALNSVIKTFNVITQKKLMVTPNFPRFLRHNDEIIVSSKISNLSEELLKGSAELNITDAITGKKIDIIQGNKTLPFTINKNENSVVYWNLKVPNTTNAIVYKVTAKAGNFSDGEQNTIPVISNRILITESLPLWTKSKESKKIEFKALQNNNSNSLKHHKLTLELTSNPTWYAIKALPYLMEQKNESSEQIFSRYYANALARYILNTNPKIQQIFEKWKNTNSLLSNLEKNKTLKSVLIENTPWLKNAQSETEQQKRIGLLFDLKRTSKELEKTLQKLQNIQLKNGGFPWFKGNHLANVMVTQHIITGFAHLKHIGAEQTNSELKSTIGKAYTFLNSKIVENYNEILKQAAILKEEKSEEEYHKYLSKNHISFFEIQNLYLKSFLNESNSNSELKKAILFYEKQLVKHWKNFNLYEKGMTALILNRKGNTVLVKKILKSIKEYSITSEELGMYWKENTTGWKWNQAPIATQALLIEAFNEIEKTQETTNKLKVWLLKNKEVNQWNTSKATTEAIYAILLDQSSWVKNTKIAEVKIGGKKIDLPKNNTPELGSGYFKTSWKGDVITKKMSNINITSTGKTITWGGIYWQYFEDIEKTTPNNQNELKVKKQLYKKVNSDNGKTLIPIKNNTELNTGDIVTASIEIHSNRNLEFIHLNDMFSTAFEPLNVISGYKWQNGLGYYQNIKDTGINFFFDKLPRGVYVFEYDMYINNAGKVNTGVATIQSLYAPSLKNYSKSAIIKIKK